MKAAIDEAEQFLREYPKQVQMLRRSIQHFTANRYSILYTVHAYRVSGKQKIFFDQKRVATAFHVYVHTRNLTIHITRANVLRNPDMDIGEKEMKQDARALVVGGGGVCGGVVVGGGENLGSKKRKNSSVTGWGGKSRSGGEVGEGGSEEEYVRGVRSRVCVKGSRGDTGAAAARGREREREREREGEGERVRGGEGEREKQSEGDRERERGNGAGGGMSRSGGGGGADIKRCTEHVTDGFLSAHLEPLLFEKTNETQLPSKPSKPSNVSHETPSQNKKITRSFPQLGDAAVTGGGDVREVDGGEVGGGGGGGCHAVCVGGEEGEQDVSNLQWWVGAGEVSVRGLGIAIYAYREV
jgi:hypothetical protein